MKTYLNNATQEIEVLHTNHVEGAWKQTRDYCRKKLVGWLGLRHCGTGYIAPVSVVNVRMSARVGLVGSYHIAPSNTG